MPSFHPETTSHLGLDVHKDSISADSKPGHEIPDVERVSTSRSCSLLIGRFLAA